MQTISYLSNIYYNFCIVCNEVYYAWCKTGTGECIFSTLSAFKNYITHVSHKSCRVVAILYSVENQFKVETGQKNLQNVLLYAQLFGARDHLNNWIKRQWLPLQYLTDLTSKQWSQLGRSGGACYDSRVETCNIFI